VRRAKVARRLRVAIRLLQASVYIAHKHCTLLAISHARNPARSIQQPKVQYRHLALQLYHLGYRSVSAVSDLAKSDSTALPRPNVR
jgi:hypothetical protein